MNNRVTSRFAIFVALLLIAVIGVLLVLQATPEGAGLSDDSIAYIAGARSMVAGHGYREAWLASNQPVTHFPPAFPAVLAFFGFLPRSLPGWFLEDCLSCPAICFKFMQSR